MISLFSFCFHTNTHLYPSCFTSSGVWTTNKKSSHFVNEINSACITSFHFGQSFLCRHSSKFCALGSSLFFMILEATWKIKKIVNNNIISIPFFYCVYITYWDLTNFRYLCLFRGNLFNVFLFRGFLFNICFFRGFLHYLCILWGYIFNNFRLISHFDGLF